MAELLTVVAGPPVELEWIRTADPVPVLLVDEDGSRVWTGVGQPTVVVGAAAGDLYLDTATGDLYRLN